MKTPDGAVAAGPFPRSEGLPSYVLVTPARDEAAFIETTINSILAQEILPLRWVIVSDGSTDGTDDIVARYAQSYPWIELVRMPERAERHFAGKVLAFNAGYQRVQSLDYDIIGNIDGDVSFPQDYFQILLSQFVLNPSLGVAGAVCVEDGLDAYDFDVVNIEDVSGACQLFRQKCFRDIGGYLPIKGGGIDCVAVYMARMKGWQTRTFTETSFFHHRRRGGAQGSVLHMFYTSGVRNYNLGGHPLWIALRGVYFMARKPYVIGGIVLLMGYLRELLSRGKRPVPPELVLFLRKEQMQRLRRIVKRKLLRQKV